MFSNNDDNDSDKTYISSNETLRVRLTRAKSSPPCMVLLIGPSTDIGRQWPIEKSLLTIGRSVQSDISIQDLSLSKSHAELYLEAGEVFITDRNSTNKTIVNDVPLVEKQSLKLKNNNRIKLGNIILKFLEKGNIETLSVSDVYDRTLKDSLTNLYNNESFKNKGKELFKKAQLLGENLSVITFDFDFFKKINDTYGHTVGDYVLKNTANHIQKKIIRNNDIFGRTGGEEFSVLLFGTNSNQSFEIAKRIQKIIEPLSQNTEGHVFSVTVSVGVSVKTAQDKSWVDIFKRADRALYKAKKAGRNQVQIL